MLAQQVQLRLELADFLRSGYEYLDYLGFRLLGGGSQDIGIDRDFPYMEQGEPGLLRFLTDDVYVSCGKFLVFGKEHQTGSVLKLFRNRDTLEQDELVRDLEQDSRSVAALVVSGLRPAVLHVLKHREGVVH